MRIVKGIAVRETESRSKDRPLQRQRAEAGSLRKLKREVGAETLRARSWENSGENKVWDTPPRALSVREANNGLKLDAASTNMTRFKVESSKREGEGEEADSGQSTADRSESNGERSKESARGMSRARSSQRLGGEEGMYEICERNMYKGSRISYCLSIHFLVYSEVIRKGRRGFERERRKSRGLRELRGIETDW